MKEAKALQFVSEFHKTFDHPIVNQPKIPEQKRANLRLNLLREELKELEEAVQNGDLIEVADALCDLQYVLSGAVLEFGLGGIFAELFAEVQRSNMSKICRSEDEAMATVKHYKARGEDAYFQNKEDYYLVFRKSDDKILKSVKYSRVDLKSKLEGYD